MDALRQTTEPLFPKILWNRPLNRGGAGRLLVAGGHSGQFSQLQAIYQLALAAGAGECIIALPDSLQKLLADIPGARFMPAARSGSLGRAALAGLLDYASEADAVAIGADLSASSETSILIEALLTKTDRPIIAFDDAFTALKHNLRALINRPNCLIVATMPQIFQLCNSLSLAISLKPDQGVVNQLQIMQQLQQASQASYVLAGRDMIVAAEGQLSLTAGISAMEFFTPATVATSAAFWMHNPGKPFQALTSAAFALRQAREAIADSNQSVLTVSEMVKSLQQTLRQENF